MNPLSGPLPIQLAEQVRCVEREIGEREIEKREGVYPRCVAAGKMKQKKADFELAAMRAVLETLRGLEAKERLL